MDKEKIPIDLLNPDYSFVDRAIEEYNEICGNLKYLKGEKAHIETSIKEKNEELSNSKVNPILNADSYAASYFSQTRLRNTLLILGSTPPILISAYKLLKGELPESYDIESIMKFLYVVEDAFGLITPLAASASIGYGLIWTPMTEFNRRRNANAFKQLTGYELTEETSKAAEDCAKYVRDRVPRES